MIVDADRIGSFLEDREDSDAAPIHRWLSRGRGKLVYSTGGKFATEVLRRQRQRLLEYDRVGRARRIPAHSFVGDERRLRRQGGLRSNDVHVIALARASGARLFYTGDRRLMKDFKDPRFVRKPRGRIYSRQKNAGLLETTICR